MSDNPQRIRILCVDDHPVVRQGIAGLLAAEPDMALVAEAANGREAIQQFRAHCPDVTLMDLQMPEMGGLDAIGAIRGGVSRSADHPKIRPRRYEMRGQFAAIRRHRAVATLLALAVSAADTAP